MASHHGTPLPTHPVDCTQERRLDDLENRVAGHGATLTQHAIALTDGKIEFASIKKDLALIMQGLAELKAQLAAKPSDVWEKFVSALIFWAVPLVGGGILFAIAKSGQIPGVHQ